MFHRFMTFRRAEKLIHEGAVQAEPIFVMGRCAAQGRWATEAQKQELLPLCQFLFGLRQSFDEYFYRNDETHFDNAVKYLVFMAALGLATDGFPYDYREVRNLSQGVYTAMKDKREAFEAGNLPIFRRMEAAVSRLM